ncbi:MAG: pilus assembly protein, partial [Clostridiales bacterium]|nr:pilus assembly protein [Clostridiales bacterium]
TGLSPCRLCRKYMSTGILYVTSQGDRYHCSLNCSGLKRTVYRVMKEEHPELRPCSKCGK